MNNINNEFEVIGCEQKKKELSRLKEIQKKLSKEIDLLESSIEQEDKEIYSKMKKQIEYLEPKIHLDEDQEERDLGSCVFSCKEQADNFVFRSNQDKNNRRWNIFHKLIWTGSGKYSIRVQEDYKCGNIIYVLIYEKGENNEN